MNVLQWRALGAVAGKYDNGSRDNWVPTGCADVTTRMNIQVEDSLSLSGSLAISPPLSCYAISLTLSCYAISLTLSAPT